MCMLVACCMRTLHVHAFVARMGTGHGHSACACLLLVACAHCKCMLLLRAWTQGKGKGRGKKGKRGKVTAEMKRAGRKAREVERKEKPKLAPGWVAIGQSISGHTLVVPADLLRAVPELFTNIRIREARNDQR